MADVELLPLPEWTKRDDLGGLVPSEVRVEMRAYTRANLAPLQAENERLRAEVDRLNDLCNGLHRSLADSQAGYVHYRDRAERLAEALRDARRALAFAAQHLPECNEPYERANRALAQEDRNG